MKKAGTFLNRNILVWMLLCILVGLNRTGPALAQAARKWPQAIKPRTWAFPRDHGAHPEYRTEWWYFTGNLSDDAKHQYGYQLTFFRQGVRAKVDDPASSWAIRDLYFAHFTITDVKSNQFRMAECLSRAGPGLAGARNDRMEVWIFNWFAKMNDSVMYLKAKKDDLELKLELRSRKPLVFHG
ncbi:MAG: carotenoid 1,2-hydratase, partial [Pseudomonadota bacterium]